MTNTPNNTPLRCLIVDDEMQARAVIRRHIAALDLLCVAGECANAVAAFSFLQQEEPVDLLFLDVTMPRMSGLELLRSLRQPPPTILTTAHREFALDGYDLDVADFLLKPISFERFMKSIHKVFRNRDMTTLPAAPLARPDDPLAQEAFLYFRVDRKMVKVFLRDIRWIESLKDYVRIVTTHQQLVSKTGISAVENMLPGTDFMRIHRSFIINTALVTGYDSASVRIGDAELPVGRLYREDWGRWMMGGR
jgi:DNA-binding LytR/AlgR family response regulator